ncbi:MAG: PEP-CTERM sorting domain-containing protein [Phycisphaerae bacterium]|nr:PEP-CTERM sorting domain-containing protein [Phycisphaerae bacterium]
MRKFCIVSICCLLMAGTTGAATIGDSGGVTFTSDLEGNKTITLDSFDVDDTSGLLPGESRQLNSVTVTVTYGGSADIAADNDDDFQSAGANARIIRTWALTGPGSLVGGDSKTVQSASVTLQSDDGDDGAFDSSPDDGKAFSSLTFSLEDGGTYFPTKAAYETSGPGTVVLTVSPSQMVNDLQWDPITPDAWQMEVQNAQMNVDVDIEYGYSIIPEPATMSLLALGGLALLRRKRR